MLQAVKIRLYPDRVQQEALSKSFGCARWYWNFALNACIQHYQETGKTLKLSVYKGMLPQLKKEYPSYLVGYGEETSPSPKRWLKTDCYSAVLQCVAINLNKAYKNFFEGRAKFPRFKSKHCKQSLQYPQNVVIVNNCLKVPKIGEIKAVFHREIVGKIKTVTISKTPSGKYYASLLLEIETPLNTSSEEAQGERWSLSDAEVKVSGIDLGLKDFAIVNDGETTEKYSNPKHIAKHDTNLKRKQRKLSRKVKRCDPGESNSPRERAPRQGSKSREKARKIVAKVHERIRNSRQDFLHKLSRKLVDENQVIVVVSPLTPLWKGGTKGGMGMIKNHKLAKSISDVGWGMFVNFLDYKLAKEGKRLVEIDRWFPSSKLCSECGHQVDKMPLNVREWTCPECQSHHDRDENASRNIRAEGIRQLLSCGTRDTAGGGDVRLAINSVDGQQFPMNSEAAHLSVG
ncbi:MAG: RNA-guided endonuclease InsQ/TnpB family protein [Spirulina sp.]